MRAAVIGSVDEGKVGHDDYEPMPRFSAARDRDVRTTLVLLPPGFRAAGLGREVLRPSSSEWSRFGLGEPVRVRSRMPGWAEIVLTNAGKEREFDRHEIPGPIDVPVGVGPDGVVAIDVPAMVRELEPFRATAMKIFKREDGWLRTPRIVLGAPRSAVTFARNLTGELRSDLADIGLKAPGPEAGERPGDASHPPIEGVGYVAWVNVAAGLVRDDVHASHVDLYAGTRGVPAGRWAAIDPAWQTRAREDPRLATWSDYDRRRMRSTGAKW